MLLVQALSSSKTISSSLSSVIITLLSFLSPPQPIHFIIRGCLHECFASHFTIELPGRSLLFLSSPVYFCLFTIAVLGHCRRYTILTYADFVQPYFLHLTKVENNTSNDPLGCVPTGTIFWETDFMFWLYTQVDRLKLSPLLQSLPCRKGRDWLNAFQSITFGAKVKTGLVTF